MQLTFRYMLVLACLCLCADPDGITEVTSSSLDWSGVTATHSWDNRSCLHGLRLRWDSHLLGGGTQSTSLTAHLAAVEALPEWRFSDVVTATQHLFVKRCCLVCDLD